MPLAALTPIRPGFWASQPRLMSTVIINEAPRTWPTALNKAPSKPSYSKRNKTAMKTTATRMFSPGIRLLRGAWAAAIRAMTLPRPMKRPAAGMDQPVIAAIRATFWKTTICKNSQGPKADTAKIRDHPSLVFTLGSMAAACLQSNTSAAATRARTISAGSKPSRQERSTVLAPLCIAVSVARPSTKARPKP